MAGTVAKTAVNIINKCFIVIFFFINNTKIMQGERNSKTEKRSFFRLDIAEPKLILYKEMKRTRKRAYYTVNPY